MVAKSDLSGQKFGRLTVLGESSDRPRGRVCWDCLCECGNTKAVETNRLKSGKTRSCGCLIKEISGDRNRKDITGQRFSRLVAIRAVGSHPTEKGMLWECKCDCGNTAVVRGSFLRSGNTTSCGCRHKELKESFKTLSKTHGLSSHPDYDIYCAMIQRCTKPSCSEYRHYGGRGITVCDRWMESFENFLEDMGDRPSPELSLERKDNNLGYSPSNCKWATRFEQGRNKRNNRIIEYLGQKYCLTDLADVLGMKITTLLSRLDKGWTVEKIANTPVQVHKRR